MNIKTLKKKLYMDGHHRMEYFGVVFVIFILLIGSIMLWAVRINTENSKYKMTGSSIVSSAPVPWSKTGTNMHVQNIYSNSDNTKVMIWLKMDDMSTLSTDPNQYSVFISPYRDMTIKHPLSGSLYMFGDTGNVALVLYDSMGFENAVMEITMRGTAIVENPDYVHPYGDSSFSNHNQACFYVNPAGTDAKIVDFLDEDVLNARDMYYEGVLVEALNETKDTLNEKIGVLRDDIAQYDQCVRVLNDSHFVIPAVPSVIVSDYVSVNAIDAASSPVVFDSSMLDLDEAVIESSHGYISSDDSGESKQDLVGDKYYYISDFVYPGGLNINVNDIDSIEDCFNAIKPAGLTYYEWRAEQREQYNEYNEAVGRYTAITDSWQQDSKIYQYGTVERYDTAINNYNNAVSKLIDDKRQYQTEDIYKIFECISDLDTVADRVTINSNSNLVTKWQHYT